MMKRIVLCVLLFSLGAVVCAARDDRKKDAKPHPDMTGTWTLDKSKSDFGPFRDRPISKADVKLVVTQRDPELKLTRTLSLNGQQDVREQTYYTDERGETNPPTLGTGEVKSKTKWDGDKVVTRSKMTRETQRGTFEIDTTEKWQLSSDGQTLTVTTEISGQFGSQEIKQVFRRAA